MKKVIHIEDGELCGHTGRDKGVLLFRGIPFAAPPVGENRWRLPQPVVAWEGIRDCNHFAAIPPQDIEAEYRSFEYTERSNVALGEPNEDCLYLNVVTPVDAVGKKLPVLFWIFGGGFVAGATSAPELDAEGFARHGIIVVQPAYRLGPLGFMAHPQLSKESPYGVSGNYGIWDLIAALKWTIRNIAAFGGDPELITIGGQSAGGGCTHTLCSVPQTQGMFRRALLHHCGGAREELFLRYRPLAEAEEIGEQTLKLLGVDTIEEARKLPWQLILEKNKLVPARENMQNMPVIDHVLLFESLTDTMLHNRHHAVDYLIGHTETTGRLPIKIDKSADLQGFRQESQQFYGDWTEQFLKVCGVDTPEKVASYKCQRYKENLLSGDINFCEAQERLGRKPAYMWEFSRTLPGDAVGTYVGSEHWFLFQSMDLCWRPFSAADIEMADKMNRYWCNFIRTGNPNETSLPNWEPYRVAKPCCMCFGDKPELTAVELTPMLQFRRDFVLRSLLNKDNTNAGLEDTQ